MSKINFACPSCNAKYSVPETAAGKAAKCKSCGKQITVPAAGGDAMPIKDTPASGGKMDMSSMYADASSKATEPTVQPPGFNFEGSAFNSQQRKSPAISPALLIGGAGGVVVLLLVVVLVVVLSGGKKDKPADTTVVETPTNRPTRGRGTSRNTPTTNPGDTETAPEVEGNPDTPFGATALTPPSETLVDWTLSPGTLPRDAVQAVAYRGMSVLLPKHWSVINPAEAAPDSFQTTDSAALIASREDERVTVDFTTYRVGGPPADGWPAIYEAEEMLPGMFADAAGDETFGTLAERSVIGCHPLKPDAFFVQDDALQSIEYGTLFGGYPFARLEISGKNDYAFEYRIMYIGYLGDVLITATIDLPKSETASLESLEAIIRTAGLLNESAARSAAQGDSAYLGWIEEAGTNLRFAESTPPLANLEKDLWPGLGENSIFANAGMVMGAVSPSHQNYAIVAPENLGPTAISSVAVRWQPDPDTGLWMQLKVTELSARQAHLDSPIIAATQADQPTYALIQGSSVALPDGYEYSTLDADGLLVHRILLPAVSFSPTQKVYYLAMDGQRQITITGHFNKDSAGDLALLDEAAATLHRFETQEPSSSTVESTQAEEETEVEPETTPGPDVRPGPGTRPGPRTDPGEPSRPERPSRLPGRERPSRQAPERPSR